MLHQGVALRTGWSFGTVTALTGLVVLLAWIPLRQRPGIGTVANLLPAPDSLLARVALLVGGVVGNGLATAAYVGARLGPGPRDGLMTGLHARTGFSVRAVRTVIEVTVLALGWLLGGTVGLGTRAVRARDRPADAAVPTTGGGAPATLTPGLPHGAMWFSRGRVNCHMAPCSGSGRGTVRVDPGRYSAPVQLDRVPAARRAHRAPHPRRRPAVPAGRGLPAPLAVPVARADPALVHLVPEPAG